jgi:hypothetical protein
MDKMYIDPQGCVVKEVKADNNDTSGTCDKCMYSDDRYSFGQGKVCLRRRPVEVHRQSCSYCYYVEVKHG